MYKMLTVQATNNDAIDKISNGERGLIENVCSLLQLAYFSVKKYESNI